MHDGEAAAGLHRASSETEYLLHLQEVVSVVDVAARFPAWPFPTLGGTARFAEFDRVVGGDFCEVLEALAAAHGDDAVTFVLLEPTVEYYGREYEYFPAFRLAREALRSRYWEALSFEPGGDPTGAIAHTGNVVAIVGSSRRWAVWGERDWELAVVQAELDWDWQGADVPFLPVREALE